MGTTDVLEILLTDAYLNAPRRETIGSTAKGDECCWPQQSHLFAITDCASGLKFLIDNGVEVSLVPHLHTNQKVQHRVQAHQPSTTLQIIHMGLVR